VSVTYNNRAAGSDKETRLTWRICCCTVAGRVWRSVLAPVWPRQPASTNVCVDGLAQFFVSRAAFLPRMRVVWEEMRRYISGTKLYEIEGATCKARLSMRSSIHDE